MKATQRQYTETNKQQLKMRKETKSQKEEEEFYHKKPPNDENQNHKTGEEYPEQRKHQNYKEDTTEEQEDQRFERVGEFELQMDSTQQGVKTHTNTHIVPYTLGHIWW
ncbi:MAG: hypothetical protein CBB71_00885 [Rhodopirellula sp. TMED11]|nr:MAG: hypothetical protein CBB71_00885 [Rhodopirellula sp. TMED11]